MGCICALERGVRDAVDGKEEIGMGMVEVGGGGGAGFGHGCTFEKGRTECMERKAGRQAEKREEEGHLMR